MEEKEFSLIDEPWIKVLTITGKDDKVSLQQLFQDAHEYKALAGELPTQDLAVLRLLLAILYAVFTRNTKDGTCSNITNQEQAQKRWSELWELRRFPYEIIDRYLNDNKTRERFYLFHPQTPFFQVSFETTFDEDHKINGPRNNKGIIIKPSRKQVKTMIGDIAESENKSRLFAGRTQKDYLTYAEAARWMLYVNSFDVAPGGAPPKGMDTVKRYGVAWLNNLGLIWVNGNNLFETLMLNLILTHNHAANDIRASWEEKDHIELEDLYDIKKLRPDNIGQLFSMEFRRLKLIKDNNKKLITGYDLWGGVSFESENAFIEPMTLWKIVSNKYFPKKHDPKQQMWRDFASLASQSEGSKRPGVLQWLDELKCDNILHYDFVQISIAGISFTNSTTVDFDYYDSLRVNLGLVSKLNEEWIYEIIAIIEITENCVKILGNFAVELAISKGLTDDREDRNKKHWDKITTKMKDKAIERAYFELDGPFRDWLAGIDPEADDIEKKLNSWIEKLNKIIRTLAEQIAQEAGERAIVGIYKKDNKPNKSVIENTAIAYSRFKSKLKTALKGGDS